MITMTFHFLYCVGNLDPPLAIVIIAAVFLLHRIQCLMPSTLKYNMIMLGSVRLLETFFSHIVPLQIMPSSSSPMQYNLQPYRHILRLSQLDLSLMISVGASSIMTHKFFPIVLYKVCHVFYL